jgi:muramoyltetrapeptide carboxypeptidase LdcA involved in peptidoglycan recycling
MKILLVLLLSLPLFADIKQNMFNLYQNKKYEKVCSIGFNNFKKHKKDEEFVSLYAFACLNSDYIDRLAIPVAMLKFSPECLSFA